MNKNNSRWIAPLLSRALSVFPVVVVAGTRQVEKTTLVRDMCPGPKRRYYTLSASRRLNQTVFNFDPLQKMFESEIEKLAWQSPN